MESRLQVMLAAVQTVRPALARFYQSLSDEQKARFNAIAPADDRGAAVKDQRDLTKLCDERAPGVIDLPIDRIAQVVQPTVAQWAALDEKNHDFRDQYARAREAQADKYFQEIIEIADAATPETVNVARLRVDKRSAS